MGSTKALHDKDIREPLFEYLEKTCGKCRIFEEKRMGNSRADLVMVLPARIIGLEIKSDADTYTRLESQTEDYDFYFDYNYVVVGTSHAMHIEEHVPEHWGIITVESVSDVGAENESETSVGSLSEEKAAVSSLDFYLLRRAKLNPNLDWKKKLSMLWRPELAHIQELNAMPKYRGMSKANLIDRILKMVPGEILQLQMCEELFQRDYETIGDTINAYREANGQKKRRRTKKRKRRYRAI